MTGKKCLLKLKYRRGCRGVVENIVELIYFLFEKSSSLCHHHSHNFSNWLLDKLQSSQLFLHRCNKIPICIKSSGTIVKIEWNLKLTVFFDTWVAAEAAHHMAFSCRNYANAVNYHKTKRA